MDASQLAGTSKGSNSLIRSPDDEKVMAKTAQIKQWVVHRLKELEEQNERLKQQNLRCTTQLQMLKSMSEKSRNWNNKKTNSFDVMSHSVTGALPVCRELENRTSDDSGLTSDEHERGCTALITDNAVMSRSIAGESTPKTLRKKMTRQNSADCAPQAPVTPSSDGSPVWEQSRPIPTPRKPRNTPINVERDSLNSFRDEYEFDCDEEEEEEMFDEVVESPSEHRAPAKYADYVNLADFCAIRDDEVVYSDIIKPTTSQPPEPPQHKTRPWESRLLDVAEKCLSPIDSLTSDSPNRSSSQKRESFDGQRPSNASASPYQVTRISLDRVSSSPRRSNGASSNLSTRSPRIFSNYSIALSDRDSKDYQNGSAEIKTRPLNIRTSLIPTTDSLEKSGYWSLVSESRLKSLKRRFVELRNGQLSFYRTQKNQSRDEEPLARIALTEIKSVTRMAQCGGNYAFLLVTGTQKFQYMTESERATEEWIHVLTQAIKGATLRELATRTTRLEASISGILQRVRCGHSKRLFASLSQHKLMFFKSPDDTVPTSFLSLQGAHICEKQKTESDEYSGSSDEQQQKEQKGNNANKREYTISIELANEDPLYLVLRSAEEKEKWLYFLRSAAGDATLCGTPFEILMQRMLIDGARQDSPFWNDLLLVSAEDPKDPMVSINAQEKKKTIEIAKACHLFVSVLMRPCAVQYHIDLAQNILSSAIQLEFVRNELYAQLIRMTSGTMPFALQGWKLLALTLPLFLPKQYALLWLLKRHIARWAAKSGDEANIAAYCEGTLEKSLQTGGRDEGPSRLEATSILTRDPSSTKFPHSISVRLPNGDYQVVEFDGSTEVGQCLSSLCLKLGMRPALLSGYALYIDHPSNQGLHLLKGKQKLCDCLTLWERRERDSRRGRISAEGVAKLELRLRHYWRHLAHTETLLERGFLVWRQAEEIVGGRVPVSSELADHLMSLYAQLSFGDLDGAPTDQHFQYVTSKFYPRKMYEVANLRTLRANLETNWRQMGGMSENECIRVILQVLRKWPLFGCSLWEAGMRTSNDRSVFVAVHDSGVHILDRRHLETIRSFPFQKLVTFGGFHNDFMITVERILSPDSHPEETPKERITFSMEPAQIEQLTTHLAEYIRCQKLVFNISK
ncbi:unnamed protein product, partial [Mesorhabditis belari]|uniref:Uncharacterized protein n=1 Tax=Mesorhabditis belari TaxID=2138241 RepID=A0AAF3F169_9BILA